MTGTVHALSADAELLDRLLGGDLTPRVHSIFDHAVNLQYGDALFTLAAASSDDAPLTLVLAVHSFVKFSLRTNERVQLADSKLFAGRLIVDFSRARRWQPVLPAWVAQPDLVADLERLLVAEGPSGGLRTGSGPVQEAETQRASLLRRTSRELESALAAGDLDEAYRYGTRLVGLGGGLTPAGDDYLLGMATVLALPGADWSAQRQVLRHVIEDNAHRTTDVSRAALFQASRGRVRESIIELLRSLVSADRTALPDRARRVLAIGHTSGADIVTGLLAGLRLRGGGATERTSPSPPRWSGSPTR